VTPQCRPSCDHSVRVITRLTQPLPSLGIEALELPRCALINGIVHITHDGFIDDLMIEVVEEEM
jgi:hypothetical protein